MDKYLYRPIFHSICADRFWANDLIDWLSFFKIGQFSTWRAKKGRDAVRVLELFIHFIYTCVEDKSAVGVLEEVICIFTYIDLRRRTEERCTCMSNLFGCYLHSLIRKGHKFSASHTHEIYLLVFVCLHILICEVQKWVTRTRVIYLFVYVLIWLSLNR